MNRERDEGDPASDEEDTFQPDAAAAELFSNLNWMDIETTESVYDGDEDADGKGAEDEDGDAYEEDVDVTDDYEYYNNF